MGIGEDFKTFCNHLIVGNSDDVEIRCKAITKRLNIDFWDSYSDINHRLYVGSYGRDTAIGVSDLDVIFILPYLIYVRYSNYQYNGQSALLQSVKKSISKAYPNTDIGGDGQVVVISGSVLDLLKSDLDKANKG